MRTYFGKRGATPCKGPKPWIKYPPYKRCGGRKPLETQEEMITSAAKTLLSTYKTGAKKRGYKFKLTDKEFFNLTSQNCHYCGSEPKSVKKYKYKGETKAEYIYNGVDRKDNDLGYVPGNCLPCCTMCNRMKMAIVYQEFIEHIERISAHISEPCVL